MSDAFALPGFRPRLARFGDGPESPGFLAGGLIEGCDKSPGAMFAAANAANYQIAGSERSGSREITLAPIRHRGIPHQLAGEAIQRDHMRVIGLHEDAVAGDHGSPVHAGGDHADRFAPLVMPDLPSRAGVERIAIIAAGDVHDAVGYHGGHFETCRAGKIEDPFWSETGDILRRDLRKRCESIAAAIAVVFGPARL